MSGRERIEVNKLRAGDRFSFIPAAWHGPSVVRESRSSSSLWKLVFDNSQVVNPPGIWYGNPKTIVRVLRNGDNHEAVNRAVTGEE